MNDPVRLIEEGATDFESTLLRAGRVDGPSRRGRRRILAGLGLGGIFSTIAVSTGAEASMRGWLIAAGGGAAGALALFTGVEMWSAHEPAHPPAPVPVVAKAVVAHETRTPLPVENAPTLAPAAAPDAPARETARPQRAPGAAERRSDGLSDEIAALESARRALARSEPTVALRALDDYARAFPERRLGSEATVLRIEALLAAGEPARARKLGEDFLRTHANGPYEKRVRSLIAESSR